MYRPHFLNLGRAAPVYPIAAKGGGMAAVSIPNVGTGRTGADTMFQRQMFWWNKVACSRFKVRYANEYGNGAGIGNGLGVLTLRAGIRISSGLQVPLYFGGQRDVVIQPGEVAESDWCNQALSVTFYADIMRATFPSAQAAWSASANRANSSSEYQEWGTALGDRTTTNWASGAKPEIYAIMPTLDIVTDTVSTVPSVLILGDSISSQGANDASAGDFFGYLQRALGTLYPWTNAGSSGLQLHVAVNDQLTQRVNRFAQRGFSHCFCPLGTNDIGAGFTSAQIIANLALAKTVFDAIGVKFIPFTLPPRTNAGNTAESVAGQWATVNAVNAHIRSNNGVGYGYFDVNSYWRDGTNNNLWRTDLGAPTSDGIHPSTVVHTAGYTPLLAALPTLLAA